MSSSHRGTTAFDRYRERLNSRQYVCAACGRVDEDGSWNAMTSGSQVVYRRQCPSCGVVTSQDYRL